MTAQRMSLEALCQPPLKPDDLLVGGMARRRGRRMEEKRTVGFIRQPGTNTHTTIPRNNLKRNIKHRIRHRISIKIRYFNTRDQQNSENKPPHIMAQLSSNLLSDKLASLLSLHWWGRKWSCGGGKGAAEGAE
jgi:hypothetical protein